MADNALPERKGKVVPIYIEDEVKNSFLNFAMSVIVSRALPDVADGLKPVHRRILYAMHEMGIRPRTPYKKSARIVGETMGKYHPHGDIPIYEALVRMAQDFSMRYQLIDGQGNFGCFTGDTKIKLLDGTERTFAELAQMPPDKIFFVYSVDASGRIVVGEGRYSRITRRNAQLVELTFDDSSTVRCTPDHRFMLRDGTWKEARHLTIDDSLMAGYFDTVPINARTNDYLRMLQPMTGEYEFVHHLADEYNEKRSLSKPVSGPFVRHHKNFNRFDNCPTNIERVSWLEHVHLHAAQIHLLWQSDDFRKAQRNGVQRYYSTHPEAVEALRQRMTACGEYMRQLWQDPDYRAKMSRALRGIEKRPLTPSQKARVARIIAERSRKMWGDTAKRAEITRAIIQAMSDPELRAQLSENTRRLWQDPEYRAKYPDDHFSKMAHALWADPATRQRHREKIARQWRDEAFRKAQQEGVRRSNARRMIENPQMMAELANKSAQSLTKKWTDPQYKRQVIRSRIAGYVSGLLAKTDYEAITPQVYEDRRDSNWIPSIKVALQYFNSFDEILDTATKYNHRVVNIRWLDERADVCDITVNEHHNFLLANGCVVSNSIDGDPPAAMRYSEARLSDIAEELLADIDKETVDFMANFDESLMEPKVLPSKFPNLLVNGSSGIAVGMATNIPPHNLGEIVDGIAMMIENPEVRVEDLMKVVKGPDFPTGGIISGMKGITDAYRSGRGHIMVRAKVGREETRSGKECLVVAEIPYQVNKSSLIESIADLIREKKIEGISALRDESDREGMRIVMELSAGSYPEVILNQLYKHTQMQTTFGIIMLALADKQPMVMGLREMMAHYLNHRKSVVIRRTRFDLDKAERRAHILEGLIKALDNLDKVISLIRKAQTTEEAREGLVGKLELTVEQADAILEMRLQRLTVLEKKKTEDELKELKERIEELKGILASEKKVLAIVESELIELKEKYGDSRRTLIEEESPAEISIQDLTPKEDVAITISNEGYIKRIPVDVYRKQRRGGKGLTGTEVKEEDFVRDFFIASTHDLVLFFSNLGKLYWLKAYEIPEYGRHAKGRALVNLLRLSDESEQITAALPITEFPSQEGKLYLVMATKGGTVKRTDLAYFGSVNGVAAITLVGDDQLVNVELSKGNEDALLCTRGGMAIRFPQDQVRSMGRTAQGVRGISLKEGDEVVSMELVSDKNEILVICANGIGKRSSLAKYSPQSRGGTGRIIVKTSERTGPVVRVMTVRPEDEFMAITGAGMIIRTPAKNVSLLSPYAQGVKVMGLNKGDRVVGVARIG